jgi:hypothetical protein
VQSSETAVRQLFTVCWQHADMRNLISKRFGRRNARDHADRWPRSEIPRRSLRTIIEQYKWVLLFTALVLVVIALGGLLYTVLFVQPYSARMVLYLLCGWAVVNVMLYLWCGYVPDVSNPRRVMETVQLVVVTVIAAALGL